MKSQARQRALLTPEFQAWLYDLQREARANLKEGYLTEREFGPLDRAIADPMMRQRLQPVLSTPITVGNHLPGDTTGLLPWRGEGGAYGPPEGQGWQGTTHGKHGRLYLHVDQSVPKLVNVLLHESRHGTDLATGVGGWAARRPTGGLSEAAYRHTPEEIRATSFAKHYRRRYYDQNPSEGTSLATVRRRALQRRGRRRNPSPIVTAFLAGAIVGGLADYAWLKARLIRQDDYVGLAGGPVVGAATGYFTGSVGAGALGGLVGGLLAWGRALHGLGGW